MTPATNTHSFTTRLSPEQLGIATHLEGPLMVVAGPGTGKTRVLTERIRYLLTQVPGHFRVLALTFTNKAAEEMKSRLMGSGGGEDRVGNEHSGDLADPETSGDLTQRVFIGTMHGFCLEVLAERGKLVGIDGSPNVFESINDRREILRNAIEQDPFLSAELVKEHESPEPRADHAPDPTTGLRQVNRWLDRSLDRWLTEISHVKSHPLSYPDIESDELGEISHVAQAYNAGLRANNAYDFDDLLLLTYRLLSENPKVADIYRRLYKFICIDEAQDMNEAQYAVLQALMGDTHRNVMLVGDPRQSIYGFNRSGPQYMERFGSEFSAKRLELTANFRSSQAVVTYAKTLTDLLARLESDEPAKKSSPQPTRQPPQQPPQSQLPIRGHVSVLAGDTEAQEAMLIVDEIQRLIAQGHPDVEGGITFDQCAVLGRTRYVLLAVEAELRKRQIPFYRQFSAQEDTESDLVRDFLLALRIQANPNDRLHLKRLAKRWGVDETVTETFGFTSDTIDCHAYAVPGTAYTDTVISHTHDDGGMSNVMERLLALACDAWPAHSFSTDTDTLGNTAATAAVTTAATATATSVPAETNPKTAEHVEKETAAKTTAAKTKTDDTTALITRASTVRDALAAVMRNPDRLNMQAGLDVMRQHADMNEDLDRLAVHEDVAVLSHEWDQFLRDTGGTRDLARFLGNRALGSTRARRQTSNHAHKSRQNLGSVALLTVHAAKGLEFDVVFMAGMIKGIFPDWRATSTKAYAEEVRNAFVAATRSRRLLYLSYSKSRIMPWGDRRETTPSPFLAGAKARL